MSWQNIQIELFLIKTFCSLFNITKHISNNHILIRRTKSRTNRNPKNTTNLGNSHSNPNQPLRTRKLRTSPKNGKSNKKTFHPHKKQNTKTSIPTLTNFPRGFRRPRLTAGVGFRPTPHISKHHHWPNAAMLVQVFWTWTHQKARINPWKKNS